MTEHRFTIDQYKNALENLVYILDGLAEGHEFEHQLLLEMDGDGWNEPMSESPRCSCGARFGGYQWTQEWRSDVPLASRADLAVEWNMHYNRQLFGLED